MKSEKDYLVNTIYHGLYRISRKRMDISVPSNYQQNMTCTDRIIVAVFIPE